MKSNQSKPQIQQCKESQPNVWESLTSPWAPQGLSYSSGSAHCSTQSSSPRLSLAPQLLLSCWGLYCSEAVSSTVSISWFSSGTMTLPRGAKSHLLSLTPLVLELLLQLRLHNSPMTFLASHSILSALHDLPWPLTVSSLGCSS